MSVLKRSMVGKSVAIGIALTGSVFGFNAYAQDADMTFFITSAGPGNGADLGGLEGADAHCNQLAAAAGSKLTNWKAYLSVNAGIDRSGDKPKVVPGVNARDRVGSGPWHNAKGVLIALAAVPGRQASTKMLEAWQDKDFTHAEVCSELRHYGWIPKSTTDDEVQKLLDVYTITVNAFKKYVPSKVEGLNIENVLLFRAHDSHEELGVWSTLLDDIDLIFTEANHFSIVHDATVLEKVKYFYE